MSNGREKGYKNKIKNASKIIKNNKERIHVMIRELASTLGYTFEEMKLLIKRKAGLCIVKNKSEYCKSFAECDKDELNLTIQALIDIGDETGSNLR